MTWYEEAGKGWRARWREPGKKSPPHGPSFPTRDEAIDWAIANGHAKAETWTMTKLLSRWASIQRAEEDGPQEGYLFDAEERLLSLCARRGWTSPADITLEAINDWKADSGGKGMRSLDYLLAVLRWAKRSLRGIALDQRVLDLRKKRRKRTLPTRHILSDEDVDAILEAARGKGQQVHALIHYLATYGARPVSALDLTIGDLELDAGMMIVGGKHSGEWRHPILPATVELFRAITAGRNDPAERVFLDPRSEKPWALGAKHMATSLNSWYFRAFRGVAPDQLRRIYHLKRYAITSMLARGIDPSTVALYTGHLTLSQVLIYARTSTTRASAVLERLGAGTQNEHTGIAHTAHTKNRRK